MAVLEGGHGVLRGRAPGGILLVGDHGGDRLGGCGGHGCCEHVVRRRSRGVGEGRHAGVGGDLAHAVRGEGCLWSQRRDHRLEEGGTSARTTCIKHALIAENNQT